MTLRRGLLKYLAMMFVGFGLALPQASISVAQVDPKRPLKVALVLPGPVSDGTFNSAAAKGIKAAQAKYPNITVSIRENTGMAQSEAALFEYASNGYDVVIGHGFQFAEGAKKIHSQFRRPGSSSTPPKLPRRPISPRSTTAGVTAAMSRALLPAL
jgi:basic membrane lipoprotein Med (substrate-binding protein (PBP1-ABC) superfamily)